MLLHSYSPLHMLRENKAKQERSVRVTCCYMEAKRRGLKNWCTHAPSHAFFALLPSLLCIRIGISSAEAEALLLRHFSASITSAAFAKRRSRCDGSKVKEKQRTHAFFPLLPLRRSECSRAKMRRSGGATCSKRANCFFAYIFPFMAIFCICYV